jgi:hypothetical protein
MENTDEFISPNNSTMVYLLTTYHSALQVKDFMGNRMYPLGFDKSRKGYFIRTRNHNLYNDTLEFREFRARVRIAKGLAEMAYIRECRQRASLRFF